MKKNGNNNEIADGVSVLLACCLLTETKRSDLAYQVFIPRTPIVCEVRSLGAPSQSAFTDQLIQISESNSP